MKWYRSIQALIDVYLNRGSGKEVSQVATIVCGYPASTEILCNKYSIISVTKYFWNLMQA